QPLTSEDISTPEVGQDRGRNALWLLWEHGMARPRYLNDGHAIPILLGEQLCILRGCDGVLGPLEHEHRDRTGRPPFLHRCRPVCSSLGLPHAHVPAALPGRRVVPSRKKRAPYRGEALLSWQTCLESTAHRFLRLRGDRHHPASGDEDDLLHQRRVVGGHDPGNAITIGMPDGGHWCSTYSFDDRGDIGAEIMQREAFQRACTPANATGLRQHGSIACLRQAYTEVSEVLHSTTASGEEDDRFALSMHGDLDGHIACPNDFL